MRLRAALAGCLLATGLACGEDTTQTAQHVRIDVLEPRVFSARGARVTAKGSRLDRVESIAVRGQPVTLVSKTPGQLVFDVPPLVAGFADVELKDAGGELGLLEDVLEIEPIALDFLASPPGWVLPGPDVRVRDAAGWAGQGSLVVATDGGVFVLAGDGRGAFTWSEAPLGGRVDVRAFAPIVLQSGRAPVLAACPGRGGALMLLSGPEAVSTTAPRDFDCVDLAAADVDADGDEDLVELSGAGDVLLWRNDSGQLSRVAPAESTAGSLSGLVAEAAGRELSIETTTDASPDGAGLVRIVVKEAVEESELIVRLPLVARDTLPVEISARARLSTGGSLTFVVRDASGVQRTRGLAPPENEWSLIRLSELTSGESDLLTAPLSAIEWRLTIPAEQGLTLELDTVHSKDEDGAIRLLAGFDVSPQRVLASPARVLTGSDKRLFAGTGAGVQQLVFDAASSSFLATTVRGGAEVSTLALADFNRDGVPDLYAGVPGKQDRLLLNDGFDAFFDATPSLLPLDEAPATHLRVRDFDLDGLPDLLLSTGSAALRLYTASASGRFLDRTATLGFSPGAQIAVPVDVDGDHDVDVVALPERGEVRVFVQRGGAAP